MELQDKNKSSYTFWMDNALRRRAKALCAEKSRQDGRFVSLAEVVAEALERGISLAERDVFSEIPTPPSVRWNKREFMEGCKLIFETGFDRVMSSQ